MKSGDAFIWIINILTQLNVPFQVAGGLAAITYGSTRPLEDIDIDIAEDKFVLVKAEVNDFIIYGPTQFKDETWDLMLMTLNYHGQLIDLSGAYDTKIYDKENNKWRHLSADFTTSEIKNIFGVAVPVISKCELLYYKKIIARPVDLIDVAQIEK
jgi:hypothetical protein